MTVWHLAGVGYRRSSLRVPLHFCDQEIVQPHIFNQQ
jgi:hypothetical protein